MEASILKSTKKVLGVAETYTAFDLDIITHINLAFSVLHDLGLGPIEGFAIEDDSAEWGALELPVDQLSMVRTYVYLKTRLAFDVPPTSFAIDALEKQIAEQEWRLNDKRERALALTEE